MHRSLTRFIAAMVLVFIAATTSVAVAAPIPWRGVDVTLHAEQSGSVILISGELPETVPLPAEAEFSVPTGSNIQWIGEILGGDPAADPELTHTKSTANGTDTYRFTLTKSRNAQIEVLTDGIAFDGSLYSMSLTWTPSQDVSEVRLIARVPRGAQVVTSSPEGSLQPGDTEYNYFTKTFTDAQAGQRLDLAVGYTLPVVATEGAGSGASGSQTVSLALLIALAVAALIALVVVVSRSKRTASHSVMSDVGEHEAEAIPAEVTGGAEDAVGDVAEDAAGDVIGSPTTGGHPGSGKRTLLTGSVIGLLVVAAVIVGAQTTKPTMAGGTISKTYSPGEPCEIATIQMSVSGETNPEDAADAIFAALGPLGGLNTATYDVKSSSLSVGYCESKTTEAAIREVLAPTGFVAPDAQSSPAP